MSTVRIIPCLLGMQRKLVKTVGFNDACYVGDPLNAIKIFNEKEVDELIFLDIEASRKNQEPDYALVSRLGSECFMPLVYGGGVKSLESATRLFRLGVEKICVNRSFLEEPELVTKLAERFGSQAILVSLDVKKEQESYRVVKGGKEPTSLSALQAAQLAEKLGAGELLLTSVDREGAWSGTEIPLLQQVTARVSIPVIAHGGIGQLSHIQEAVIAGGASAVAVGSLCVYSKRGKGVLISFPKRSDLKMALGDRIA